MWKELWNWLTDRHWKSFEVHVRKKILLLERWTLKVILLRSQMEIRDMFLETVDKVTLIIRWQVAWFNCALVFVERRIIDDKLGDLAEKISKKKCVEAVG